MKTRIEPLLTMADVEAMPDDGTRYEVVEGELYMSAAPSYFHQRAMLNVAFAIHAYLIEHPIGEVCSGIGLVFDEYNGVIPDLVFFSNTRKREILVGGRLVASPELVVEFVSPGSENSRRDRQVKRKLYGSRGVEEYWIIDIQEQTCETYKLRKRGLERSTSLAKSDTLTSPLLPGFSCPVQKLFE